MRKHGEKNLIISVRVLAFLLVVNSDLAAFLGGLDKSVESEIVSPKRKHEQQLYFDCERLIRS